MNNQLVEMVNISKQFDGQVVLLNSCFSVNKGEVCSILGENASGKTTLMKILAGVFKQDSGKIFLDGCEVSLDSPIISQKLGIHMIYQETQLIDFFSVEKNIFIGKEITYGFLPLINKRYQIKKAKEILDYLKTDIDVNTPVEELAFAQKKNGRNSKSFVI